MKIEINGQSGDGKVLKVLIQRWLVVCCIEWIRIRIPHWPGSAWSSQSRPPTPCCPVQLHLVPGYASLSAVIMTGTRLVIHRPGLLNTLDTVPLLMGRIGYAWQWAQVRWVQHTRRYTHIQAVFGLSVADFLISMEHQPLTIKLCNCIPKQTSQNSRYLHIHCLWVMESES